MSLKLKVRIAQIGIFCRKVAEIIRKAHKEAQKLALAVVILEFMLAGGWYIIETNGYIDELYQKQVNTIVFKPAEAKEIEQAKPEKDHIEELSDLIWLRESTRGKNNYSKCEAQGLINGIGFAIPGNGKYICFKDHAEEMQALDKWIKDKQAKGMTTKELLCLYSGNNYKDICQEGYSSGEKNISKK
jgi:hypothetical protein